MGQVGWGENCELGTSYKLAPAGGVSHTGDYGTCRTSGTNGTGRTGERILNCELGTSCKLPPAGGGTFVKDKNGNLVDVSQVATQIIRMK